MKRRVSPYIVALPAFLLVILFKVIPVIYSLILSLSKFDPKMGFGGSETVGFANYFDFFRSYYFLRLLRNTFVLTILPIVMTCVVSFIAALCIVKLPYKWARCLALSVLAIPAFVPVPLLCGIVKELCDSDSFIATMLLKAGIIGNNSDLLTESVLYPLIYSITETLRFMFYPIALGVLAAYNDESKALFKILRVVGAYALIRLAFFFVMDREITVSLYNPMVYEIADTIYSFTYRKGLLEFNYGYSAAVDVVQIVFQLVLNVFLVMGIKKLLPSDDTLFAMPENKNFRLSALAGTLGVLLVCVGSALMVYCLVSGLIKSSVSLSEVLSDQTVVKGLLNSFVYSIGSAVVFTLVSIFLAYPLASGKRAYAVGLFFVMISNGTTAEWLIYRALGLIDSGFAVMLSGGISVAGAYIIHLFTRQRTREVKRFRDFIVITAPAAVIILALNFILVWGSTNAITYLQTRDKFPISFVLRERFVLDNKTLLFTEDGLNGWAKALAAKYLTGIIGSLPPLIVGWALIWFNKKFFGVKKLTDKNSKA